MGCLLGAAIIVVAVPAPHAAEPVTISYAGDLARLARLAPYPAVAPAGLPASWQPVSSGLAVGGANGPGTVTWQLGFMTPDGALAALAGEQRERRRVRPADDERRYRARPDPTWPGRPGASARPRPAASGRCT